jgi:5'-deoxynucleotidase YfbR-like HD superfamily hydrolase
MSSLANMIENRESKQHIQNLYAEYSAHMSGEANYVKSLDLFDMYLQAYEYELLYDSDLSEFFQKVPHYLSESSFFEPQVKGWLNELLKIRNNKINILPYDSNLNTLLKDILNKNN